MVPGRAFMTSPDPFTAGSPAGRGPHDVGLHDVIVVGAGLAGLRTATLLQARGYAVLVVEAQDRVGGRVLTRDLGGEAVDLGAQWIGPHQRRMRRLVRELGLTPAPQYTTGQAFLDLHGELRPYKTLSLPVSVATALELAWWVWTTGRLRGEVKLQGPASSPRTEWWDTMTVEDWTQRFVRRAQTRVLLRAVVRAVFAAEAQELSFLHFLYYLQANGGLLRLIGVRGGAQQDRLRGGAGQLTDRLARALQPGVLLSSPVTRIEHERARVRLHTPQGVFLARCAVITAPPPVAGRISFDPPLPAERQRLMRDMPMGSVIKANVLYPRPFWRAEGFSGEVLGVTGQLELVFDHSRSDGAPGVLVVFIAGARARAWAQRSGEERRRMVVRELTRYFGPEALNPLAYTEQDWTHAPYVAGAYAGLMRPGMWNTVGQALRRPLGPLFWAGTESATSGYGYLEGALQSAERVVEEVTAHLKTTQPQGP